MDTDEAVAAAMAKRAIAAAISACGEAVQPTAAGKAKATAAPVGKRKGKAKATDPTAPKKKGGRPKGSLDSKPRAPRSANKVAWVYEGTKASKGRQVAQIGATVEHGGFGRAILLEQVDLYRLQLAALECATPSRAT